MDTRFIYPLNEAWGLPGRMERGRGGGQEEDWGSGYACIVTYWFSFLNTPVSKGVETKFKCEQSCYI